MHVCLRVLMSVRALMSVYVCAHVTCVSVVHILSVYLVSRKFGSNGIASTIRECGSGVKYVYIEQNITNGYTVIVSV